LSKPLELIGFVEGQASECPILRINSGAEALTNEGKEMGLEKKDITMLTVSIPTGDWFEVREEIDGDLRHGR